MTEADLKEIEDRANAATHIAWDKDWNFYSSVPTSDIAPERLDVPLTRQDINFYCEARKCIPLLIAEIRKLRETMVDIRSEMTRMEDMIDYKWCINQICEALK